MYSYIRLQKWIAFFSFSEKTNAMHMYNVEHKVWIKVRETSSHGSYLPEPRAYHSSVVAGDYMVIYGNLL